MQKLIVWWQELGSKQRDRCKKLLLFVTIFALASTAYLLRSSRGVQALPSSKGVEQELGLGPDALEQDIRAGVNMQVSSALQGQEKVISELQEQIKELKEARDRERQQQGSLQDLSHYFPKNMDSYPGSPSYPSSPTLGDEQGIEGHHKDGGQAPMGVQLIGGIKITTGAESAVAKPPGKKKSIFLPPSFMTAKLMTGIDARTSQHAESNPEPIMFRVQAPAVLPNHLKANLKGCFVVADAIGDLAKERVKVRLQSLSCLNEDGNAVINQAIEGFVTDEDGKRDMAGIVVSRAGSHLARSFAAGLIGGVGEAVQSSQMVSNIGPLGVMQVPKADGIVKAGVGGGLKTATGELQKFYLDLAKQALPVIEVGAAKDVTVVIQQGVELEIREF